MTAPTEFLTFSMDVRPVPKGRSKTTRNGRHYTPEATRNYETHVAWAARMALRGRPRNEVDDLGVIATFYLSDRQRCDVDNLVKSLLDGMNKIAWRDDNQVTELRARLVRGADHDGTEVVVYIVDSRGRECLNCKTPLSNRQLTLRQVFCSKPCYDLQQRRGTYKACAGCGTAIYRQNDKAKAETSYCTPQCRRDQHGKCRQCGVLLEYPPSTGKRFCGRTCSEIWHRARVSANPAAMLGTCELCGSPCSRNATRCRACFLSRRPADLINGTILDQMQAVR